MEQCKCLNGLQLKNYPVGNQQIKSVATIKSHTFIYNRNRLLSLEWNSALTELVTQALLVGQFE